MSLVIETGASLSNANSYVSLVDATSYAVDYGLSSAWSMATEASQEEALRLGTQYIDLEYSDRFKGNKTTRDQALAWPRTNVVDSDGFTYNSDEMPVCLKYAVVEAAIRVLDGDSLLGVIEEPGIIRYEKITAGTIEDETEYVDGKSQVPSYPKIDALLRPILT